MQINGPKIGALDFETTPIEAWTWGPKWEANLLDIIRHSQIMSFTFKWVGGKQITKGWIDYKGYKPGKDMERVMLEEVVSLINQADILTGHNIKDFDIKVLNARLAFYNIKPPRPYKVVDTKTEAKKYLRLPSYSLDDICNYFGIARKMHHTGFPMWLGCMAGNKKDWKTMLAYNDKDGWIQEQVYLRIRPFMKTHPNFGMYKEGVVCPNCGSDKLNWEGWHRNKTTRYHSFSCKDCGAWGRDHNNVQEIKPMVAI